MAKQKPVEELSFEEAFSELQEKVNKLESGERSLEQSVQIYERGQSLAARCTNLLEEAELKLEELTPEVSEGNAGSGTPDAGQAGP